MGLIGVPGEANDLKLPAEMPALSFGDAVKLREQYSFKVILGVHEYP